MFVGLVDGYGYDFYSCMLGLGGFFEEDGRVVG